MLVVINNNSNNNNNNNNKIFIIKKPYRKRSTKFNLHFKTLISFLMDFC